jgi:hypothetical protein
MLELAERTQIPAQPLAVAPHARSANPCEHKGSATGIDFWQNEPNLRDPFNLASKMLTRPSAGRMAGQMKSERRASFATAHLGELIYPGFGTLPPQQIVAIVRSAGLGPLGRPARQGPVYVVRANNRAGQELRVLVDAQMGRIVKVVPLATAGPSLPPKAGPPLQAPTRRAVALRGPPPQPPRCSSSKNSLCFVRCARPRRREQTRDRMVTHRGDVEVGCRGRIEAPTTYKLLRAA